MKNISNFSNTLLILFSALILLPIEIHGQWLRTKGAERQIIQTFAVKGSTLFAGGLNGPYPDTMYVGGAFRSTDNGASWVQINNGFFSGSIFNISVFSLAVKDSLFFAGTQNGIFVSTNNGDSWKQTSFDPLNGEVRSLLVIGSDLYAGTDAGQIRSMRDTAGGVFCSSDNGKTWIPMNSGLRNNNGSAARLTSLITMGTDLFAGTWDGGVFHSSDHGLNWEHNDTSNAGGDVTSLAVIDSNLFAGNWQGGVFRSADKGTTWTRCDSGLIDTVNHYNFSVRSFGVSRSNLFVGTEFHGVYLSTDLGGSWNAVNDGLTMEYGAVQSIFVSEPYAFIGSEMAIWRRSISEMTTSVENLPVTLPKEFVLEQNYPNPFNPTTHLRFAIAKFGFVQLKVFDVLGREVATLINEQKSPGTYEVNFNGSNLASGIYFYTIRAGDYKAVRKMSLLK